MSYLSDAKIRLRITSTAYDNEIEDLISAAMDDMGLVGVTQGSIGSESPLVRQAILTYVKANFGYDNPDRDKLIAAYESMRNQMSMTLEHGYLAITFFVTDGGLPVRNAVVVFDDECLETGAAGTVTFYRRPGNNFAYTVTADAGHADGLVDVVGSAVTVQVAL